MAHNANGGPTGFTSASTGLSFPEEGYSAGDNTFAIPESAGRERLSPALDPLARMRLSAIAKWMLIVGVLLLVFGLPFLFPHRPLPSSQAMDAAQASVDEAVDAVAKSQKAVSQARGSNAKASAQSVLEDNKKALESRKKTLDKARTDYAKQKGASDRSNLAPVIAAAMLAAILATGIPRLLLPVVFGRWHESVEAFRDWLVVGVVTGGLYLIFLSILKLIKPPPGTGFLSNLIELNGATSRLFDPVWMMYRLPLVMIAALIGLLVAQRLALRSEGLVSSNALKAIGEVLIQSVLIGILVRPLERVFEAISEYSTIGIFVLLLSGVLIIGAIGIIYWAFDADQHAASLHRQGKPTMTGVDASNKPVPMFLSVIGGRESGKTVLLAAAYYEWLTSPFGNLRIKPAATSREDYTYSTEAQGTDLEQVADELYVGNRFPVGTVSTQNLPFDIAYGRDSVCRFSMLDFPGGAVVGRAADQRIVQEFWDRLENSDALLIIADMSYVRRGKKDPGFTQVFAAYVEAMRRLMDRNGKRRVIPIALVLTKCDEYFDPAIGGLNFAAIREGLEEFGYTTLENTWRQMCEKEGQKIVEFETFTTSAITYSEPQTGPDGEYDFSLPFKIITPPPAITPNGCASPILWLTAKVMRWNVTAFRDLSSFLFGASPTQRRRIEAIIEMERVAEEKKSSRAKAGRKR